ncbi:MAG: PIN domain-containing protein [Novosphingobium sp.]
MILLDTSVWIDHLRAPEPRIATLLGDGQVVVHAFVVAELAMGSLARRDIFLAALQQLPRISTTDESTFLEFVAEHRLAGTGLGMVDAHLLASVSTVATARLWSRDKHLVIHAQRLGLTYST